MPSYKVTSPEGKSIILTGDSPPTESELNDIFSVSLGSIRVPEKTTKSDPLKEYKNENIGDVFNNIFVRPGAAVRSAIKGKGFQEGFADPNSTKTFQQSFLEKYSPNTDSELLNNLLGMPVSATGLAADVLTNPADLLGLLVGKAPIGGTGTTLEGMIASSKAGQAVEKFATANRSAKLLGREVTPGSVERLGSMEASAAGRKKVSQLLPTADLATDIKANRPSGVQSEGLNLIKKTKNPQDVVNKFRTEKQSVLNQVDQLVSENNQPVEPKFIKSRVESILQKQFDNSTPTDRIKLKNAIKDEIGWIDEQGSFDTVGANARKRFLYQETQNLQKKQNKGMSIITQPEKQIVKDAFSQAYKEAIERTHPDISKLNSRFAGLDQGETAAAKLTEVSIEGGSRIERMITQVLGRPSPQSVAAAGVRELPFFGKSTGKITGQIEKLSGKSADLLNKSRIIQGEKLLDKFIKDMPNREYFKVLLPPKDILKLSAPVERPIMPTGLPSPSDMRASDIRSGRFLPQGQGSGPTINVPESGRSPINLGEFTDSQIKQLSKKWGVPERNVRESIKASDIQPIIKSSKREGLVMSKTRRSEIEQVLKRRSKNFK